VKTSDLENSGSKKSSRQGKKGIPHLIDENSYKIMDIFKYNNDLNTQGTSLPWSEPVEKLLRIKKILEDVAENCTSKTEELEDQINKLKQETSRVSMMSRADTSTKIISELEARLFESEKEKVPKWLIFLTN
jgi:TolA-binding protein